MKTSYRILLPITVTTLVLAGIAFAAPDDDGRRGLFYRGYDACSGKQAGDRVEFTNRRGQRVNATCAEVQGQLMPRPTHHRGYRNHPMTGWGHSRMDGLDLTDQQQEQMETIIDQHREARQSLRQEMKTKRAAVQKAMSASPVNEKALRKALAELNRARTDAVVERARMKDQLIGILTPEQQKKMASQNLNRGHRGDSYHHRRGNCGYNGGYR